MTMRQRIEDNVVIVVAGIAIAAFAAGWAVPGVLRENNGLVVISQEELNRLHRIEEQTKGATTAPATAAKPSQKTVAIVDNTRTVYDPVSLAKGRTNFDDIYDSLRNRDGFQIHRLQTYEDWADYPLLDALRPDIVVVHHSAFYKTTSPDVENHLGAFLAHIGKDLPFTKVIVYSRIMTSEEDEKRYVADWTNKIPDLGGRLFALSIPSGPSSSGGSLSSFKSANNTGRLWTKIEAASAR